MMKLENVLANIEATKARSAWAKGVKVYAYELAENLAYYDLEEIGHSKKLVEKAMLDGASDWSQYSWGGCSLIYDCDIAERLSNPTELKRTRHGKRYPNKNEQWLDTQARALFQASKIVHDAVCAEHIRSAINDAYYGIREDADSVA